MNWWVQEVYYSEGAVALFSWVFWVIFSICLHELGHGFAAIWNGDNTPREMGRMNLNPLVHMGVPSLIVFAVIGIAWGVMPTDPSRYRHERFGQITVAAAGPAVNLILATLCLFGCGAWMWAVATDAITVEEPLRTNVYEFLYTGGWLNVLLAVFNLMPVPPLDGSRILGGLVPSLNRFFQEPAVQLYGLLVFMVLMFSTVWRPMVGEIEQRYLYAVGDVAHMMPERETPRPEPGDTVARLYWVLSPEVRSMLDREIQRMQDADESTEEPSLP
jgi:Zn-dependent protease